MQRKKVTIRGVDTDIWDVVMQYREDERVLVGSIINQALIAYFDLYEDEEGVE